MSSSDEDPGERVDSMIHRHLADFLSCDVPRRSRVEEEEAGDYLHWSLTSSGPEFHLLVLHSFPYREVWRCMVWKFLGNGFGIANPSTTKFVNYTIIMNLLLLCRTGVLCIL